MALHYKLFIKDVIYVAFQSVYLGLKVDKSWLASPLKAGNHHQIIEINLIAVLW